VSITIGRTVVHPNDLVFSDPINGVVVIPLEKVDQVLDLLPKLTAADDRVNEAVRKGMSVQEAFNLYRGNL
jgi:regulator of RNase E activity RraA